MAKTTITQITDDLDGSKGAQTVTFAFEGVEYSIDLAKRNRAAFEKFLKPYIDAGNKVPRTTPRKSKGTTKASGHDLSAVRAWAQENGHKVSERGRIAASVLTAYEAAH